jgi:hypothetical protein
VIARLRGSSFHSVIVSLTRSSSVMSPCWTASIAATPVKLLVPLASGCGRSESHPSTESSNTTLPSRSTRSTSPPLWRE